uniref:Uncharacterized protein n=1 Tax=Bactrocera dorsalis TaxID=27457 RepID=A0A034VKD1_BACDO
MSATDALMQCRALQQQHQHTKTNNNNGNENSNNKAICTYTRHRKRANPSHSLTPMALIPFNGTSPLHHFTTSSSSSRSRVHSSIRPFHSSNSNSFHSTTHQTPEHSTAHNQEAASTSATMLH